MSEDEVTGKTAFAKYEGTGNDFIIVEDLEDAISISPDGVAALCERRFGIGADGLMLIRRSRLASFRMDFYNADGTPAEMCGNGIRCFAKYLHDFGLINDLSVDIETGAGVKEVQLIADGNKAVGATVDMGRPALEAEKIPVQASLGLENEALITLDSLTFEGVCVSMGNPHFVVFTDDIRSAPVADIGPQIENHPAFPNKTNVEFVKVLSNDELELRVWERGVGETLACGTGACAAAVAANLKGLAGRRVKVNLPGGTLAVEWAREGNILLSGPARLVFTGSVDLSDF